MRCVNDGVGKHWIGDGEEEVILVKEATCGFQKNVE